MTLHELREMLKQQREKQVEQINADLGNDMGVKEENNRYFYFMHDMQSDAVYPSPVFALTALTRHIRSLLDDCCC